MFFYDARTGIYPPVPDTPLDSPEWRKFRSDLEEASRRNRRNLIVDAVLMLVPLGGMLVWCLWMALTF